MVVIKMEQIISYADDDDEKKNMRFFFPNIDEKYHVYIWKSHLEQRDITVQKRLQIGLPIW